MKEHPLIENKFFSAVARFSVEQRWLVIGLSLALLAGMLFVISKSLVVDTSIESFSEQGSEAQRVLEEYRAEFGRDGMYVVIVEGDVFSAPFFDKLSQLHQAMLGLNLELDSLKVSLGQPVKGEDEPSSTLDGGFEFDDDDDDGFDDEKLAGPKAATGQSKSSITDVSRFEIGNVARRVDSLVSARRTYVNEEGALVVGRLAQPYPKTANDFDRIRKLAKADANVSNRLVSNDGRYAIIALQTHPVSEKDSARIYREVKKLANASRDTHFHPVLGGTPSLNASLNQLLMSDLSRMLTLSILVMIGILTYLFRHILAVFAPLYVVGFSAIVMVGTLAMAGIPLTMMSNILPAFLFCVGIGHSVHLISVYRDIRSELDLDDSRERTKQALVSALGTTGVPIFFTSITTMVGLLSFWFASITAIQEMGVSGAYAVGVAFIASCTLLPAILSFHQKGRLGKVEPGRGDFIDRFLGVCLSSSGVVEDDGCGEEPALGRTRRKRMLWINILLMLGMGIAASQLSVWHNPLSWIPEEQPIKRAFDLLDEHVGGTANVQLLIKGKRGQGLDTGMRDVETLQAIEKIEADIRNYQHPELGQIVGNSVSLLNVVKETHRALNGDNPKQYRLPDSDRGVADMLFMFENAGPDEMSQLTTGDLGMSQMTVQMKWLEASQFRALTPYIDASIARHAPEGVVIKATGAVYTLVSTIGQLIWDLLSSFGMAFVVITILMIMLLGGVKLGVIAMVPNLMPVLVIMGVMQLSGIPIDMNNILIASISIGLAVDDTIHLLHHFRVNFRATGNVEVSIRRAMSHSGRAMVSTTLILMLGFFVYMGAQMTNIQRFGMLIGLTALFALLIDLFFAPALLRTFYGRTTKTDKGVHE